LSAGLGTDKTGLTWAVRKTKKAKSDSHSISHSPAGQRA
jgi:hypothetical protein